MKFYRIPILEYSRMKHNVQEYNDSGCIREFINRLKVNNTCTCNTSPLQEKKAIAKSFL